jgi:hypothetical protein
MIRSRGGCTLPGDPYNNGTASKSVPIHHAEDGTEESTEFEDSDDDALGVCISCLWKDLEERFLGDDPTHSEPLSAEDFLGPGTLD